MRETMQIPVEVVACILEINSELSGIIEEGLTPDSMELLERINNQLESLITDMAGEEKAS